MLPDEQYAIEIEKMKDKIRETDEDEKIKSNWDELRFLGRGRG